MSGHRAVLAAWRNALRDSDLDSTAKLVGFVLSTYFDGNGNGAHPSQITLAAGASLSTRFKGSTAIAGAIDRLEAAGFIEVERRRGQRGFRYTARIPGSGEGLNPAWRRGNGGDANPGPDERESRSKTTRIPRRGEGESEESDESVSLTRAGARSKKKSTHRIGTTYTRPVRP